MTVLFFSKVTLSLNRQPAAAQFTPDDGKESRVMSSVGLDDLLKVRENNFRSAFSGFVFRVCFQHCDV